MSTVLITGANRGIGLEFTRQYVEDGWTVIACCRDPDGEGAEDLKAIAAGATACSFGKMFLFSLFGNFFRQATEERT